MNKVSYLPHISSYSDISLYSRSHQVSVAVNAVCDTSCVTG